MCLGFILNLFSKPVIQPTEPIVRTHPEEAMNPAQTVANTSPKAVELAWLSDWLVPVDQWDWWRDQIAIYIYDQWPSEVFERWPGFNPETPAYAVDLGNGRELNCLAKWFNAGVIAHENAHNAMSLLSIIDKAQFHSEYLKIKDSPVIKMIFPNSDSYGVKFYAEHPELGDLRCQEIHADIYRYLGHKMPKQLKRFYPKLF